MNTFNIYFDGGTKGGPSLNSNSFTGDGYGSWEVEFNGFSKKVSRTIFKASEFGHTITNNVAEYLSLIGALKWIQSVQNRHSYDVFIQGDSQLVLYTLSGVNRVHKNHLKILRDEAISLLSGFKWKTKWYGRDNNVERFGH